jgi:hypothetical protein
MEKALVRRMMIPILVVPGLLVTLLCSYYLLVDWALLRAAFARFDSLAQGQGDMRSLFIAEAQQNMYRINCFCEGVGALLGMILAAIGLHALAVSSRVANSKDPV